MVVDIGVTKAARFVDKAVALERDWDYMYADEKGLRRPVEQVHLTGFDTLIRLLDIKYYPPEHELTQLGALFNMHRVRVTRRTHDAWWVNSCLGFLYSAIRNARCRSNRSVESRIENGHADQDCFNRGGREAQNEYLNNLREGDREDEGGKREWADKIELVDGRSDGEEIISSTKVREAAKAKDVMALKRLVPDGVAKWILDEKLYRI